MDLPPEGQMREVVDKAGIALQYALYYKERYVKQIIHQNIVVSYFGWILFCRQAGCSGGPQPALHSRGWRMAHPAPMDL